MDPARNLIDLDNYRKSVLRKRVHFSCPKCRLTMLPKDYEKHCIIHGLKSRLCCVWCWGSTSWKHGKKSENALHLQACFQKFIAPYKISAALKKRTATKKTLFFMKNLITSPTVINVHNILCPGRTFLDHDSQYIKKVPKALDLFSLLPLETTQSHSHLYADDSNLNLAVSCLMKYLETKDTHDWLHIMVKAVAFESFVRAMEEEDCMQTGLLPFSCWCDGGPYAESRHRQHRHMVAVAPKDYFEFNVWDKVGLVIKKEDRPCKNYPTKGMKRIVSPMHLLNTLGYLSKRKSRCEFPLKKKKKDLPPLTDKHFYIFTTLPVQFRLPLAVTWDEGLKKLMYQQLFQNVSVETIIKYPLDRANSQWRQKIDDFYNLPRELLLPVDRDLVPTASETPLYVYLLNGRKLHFERLPEPLHEKSWLERQVAGGNCFYDAVGGEWWTPRKDDQEKLNLVMPKVYEIRELKQKVDQLTDENRRLNDKIQNIYEEEIRYIKSRVTELENKLEKCTCSNSSSVATTANHNDHVTINNNFNK